MNQSIDKLEYLSTQIIRKFVLFLVLMCIMLFLPARTIRYWEAWIYLGMLLFFTLFIVFFFLKRNPDFLIKRIKNKEEEPQQGVIMKLGLLLTLTVFILPGFDKYFKWSQIPAYIVLISDILVILGYLLVFKVFKENSYASRVIEINTNQKVIDTEPYSRVRHPMYTGILIMIGFTPLALGSYWSLIGSVLMVIIVIARIYGEEKFLKDNLQGYKEYLNRVKYRIIPGIW
jgi:protein-S-isoprenylcysteine O-methyltransferase Ste14